MTACACWEINNFSVSRQTRKFKNINYHFHKIICLHSTDSKQFLPLGILYISVLQHKLHLTGLVQGDS
jgi:hypothetical protein